MHRVLVVTLASVLVLVGCGSDQSDASPKALESISVTDGKTPKVTGAKDVRTNKTVARTVKSGGGDQLSRGDTVRLNFVAINARTGKQFDGTYASGKAATFTLTEQAAIPGFSKALVGEKVGSRVLAVVPPKDGIGQDNPQFEIKKSDTLVFVFDVVSKVPPGRALPSNLPQLKLNDSQPERFVAGKRTDKSVKKPSVSLIIPGDGEKVKLNQTIQVNYLGQVFPAGKVFDSSYGRGPASFQLAKGGLIPCWTDLLPGQKVGTRVALACPSEDAYGKKGSPPTIKPGDDLIFVIDILAAS